MDLPLPIPNTEVKPERADVAVIRSRRSRRSPIFILEKGIMDISSILWGFIASYLAGSLPSLREIISTKDKTTLDERIEQCYQTALKRWCADDAVRQRIAHKYFNDLNQLKELYLTEEWEKKGAILNSLAQLWTEELSKDEEVSGHLKKRVAYA